MMTVTAQSPISTWKTLFRMSKRKTLFRILLAVLVIVTVMYGPIKLTTNNDKEIAINSIGEITDGPAGIELNGHVKFLGISQSANGKTILKFWELEEIGKLYFASKKSYPVAPILGVPLASPLAAPTMPHTTSIKMVGSLPLTRNKHLIPLIFKDRGHLNTKEKIPAVSSPKKQTITEQKTILLWNNFYGHNYDYLGKAWPKDYCPETRCNVTHDKSLLKSADAVVFHMWPADKWEKPKIRSPQQRYVFLLTESPLRYDYHLEQFDHFFNLTMTYRVDSDMPFYYGNIVTRKDPILYSNKGWLNKQSKIKDKTRPIAWIVSHCKSDSLRESYVKELQNYIEVDVYGKCGPLQCLPKMSKKCYDLVQDKYKFVLSFENSLCTDYITEKFFNNARSQIVTITYGMGNYKKIMPPNSFIDTADFKSPEALATFLLKLMKDDAAYLSYLEWQRDYIITLSSTEWRIGFCKLCENLHDKNAIRKSYSATQLEDFWGKKTCKGPSLFQNNTR